MKIPLTHDQARHLYAIGYAGDPKRPPFDRVVVRYGGLVAGGRGLRVLACNNYVLAMREIPCEVPPGAHTIYPPAKWWAKEMREATKVIRNMTLEWNPDEVGPALSISWGGDGGSINNTPTSQATTTDTKVQGRYPLYMKYLKWESTEKWGTVLPTFSGDFLQTAIRSLGVAKADMLKHPLKMVKVGEAVGFVSGNWTSLLMPVVEKG